MAVKQFMKLGHECELPEETDDILKYKPDMTIQGKIQRYILRTWTISDSNPNSRKYFGSFKAIARERRRQLRDHTWVIHPFSSFRIGWEMYMTCILFMSVTVIPYYTCFIDIPGKSSPPLGWVLFDHFLDCSCIVNIVVNFWTGYFDKSKSVVTLNFRDIAIRYIFRGYFFIEFISSVPIDYFCMLFLAEQYLKHINVALGYIVLLRILRVITMVTYGKQSAMIFGIPEVKTEFTLLVGTTLLCIHWSACFYFTIAVLFKNTPLSHLTWISRNDMWDVPQTKKYLLATFRSLSNLVNVGFGYAPPQITWEQLFSTFLSILGRFGMMLILAHAIQWATIMNASTAKYEEMVQQLKTYMHCKKLPPSLQNRLLNYYEFRFNKSYFQEAEILSTLNGQLREEIMLHSCRRLVENVEFFHNLPMPMLVKIVTRMTMEIYLLNDVILKASTKGDCMYFLSSGTVAIFTPSGREVCHLQDGSHFGEIALVMNDELRVASVVAVENCEVFRLDRQDFQSCIKPYPDLLSRIERISLSRLEKTREMDEQNRRQMKSSFSATRKSAHPTNSKHNSRNNSRRPSHIFDSRQGSVHSDKYETPRKVSMVVPYREP